MITRKRGRTALCAAALTAVLTLLFAASVFALPPAPADHSVYDEAGVLGETTILHIAEKNRALYAMTGAEIAIAIVRSTGFETIEDYSRELFTAWGIGSAERSNGVLLIVSVAKNEYYALQGTGLSELFSDNKLKLLLTEHMAPSAGAGDTETGVLKTYDAMYSFLEAVYGISAADWDGSETYTDLMRGGVPSDGGATSGVHSLSDKVFGAVKIMFVVLVIAGAVVAAIAVYSQVMCAKETRLREAEIMRRRAGSPDAAFEPSEQQPLSSRRKLCGCQPPQHRPQRQQPPPQHKPQQRQSQPPQHKPQQRQSQPPQRNPQQQRQSQPPQHKLLTQQRNLQQQRQSQPPQQRPAHMPYNDVKNERTPELEAKPRRIVYDDATANGHERGNDTKTPGGSQ